jgi:hypothetical protein
MTELKPCPFCGKMPASHLLLVAFDGPYWNIRCDCGANIEWRGESIKHAENEARRACESAWNRRAWPAPVLFEIAAERERQTMRERYDAGHDAKHSPGCLARAGAAYALLAGESRVFSINETRSGGQCVVRVFNEHLAEQLWPWDDDSFKPKDARRNLVRAAALIVAEIERMDRALEVTAKTGDEV